MRKKPAMSGVACEGTRGARGAAFSAVPLADIKSALRWNTLAFGEQPSCSHHLCPHMRDKRYPELQSERPSQPDRFASLDLEI
ncbi:hypothetical protein MSG28_012300 [Choristoneura fumiferana]|uniref:Uncharacterized protein n=1 Tax=Choristoneura fumiferana TaxID=7141 RepID=A0ACC0KCI6_CHOFU|nr:hypothetical protein MSG28_012300 [Choristoneura fumiferana]